MVEELEKYRLDWESDDQWNLRKSFIQRHEKSYDSINRLICLSQIFINMEFLGCRYNKEVMKEVKELSKGLGDKRREERRAVIRKTFLGGGVLGDEEKDEAEDDCKVVSGDPLAEPQAKKARQSQDGDAAKKSSVGAMVGVLKKEKVLQSLKGILKLVLEPGSNHLKEKGLTRTPVNILNYICNHEKLLWRIDLKERKENQVKEAFLSIDDVLIVRQFAMTVEDIKESAPRLAIERLEMDCWELKEELSNDEKIPYSFQTGINPREGCQNSPDEKLCLPIEDKMVTIRKCAMDRGDLESDALLQALATSFNLQLTVEKRKFLNVPEEDILVMGGVVLGKRSVTKKERNSIKEAEIFKSLCDAAILNMDSGVWHFTEDKDGWIEMNPLGRTGTDNRKQKRGALPRHIGAHTSASSSYSFCKNCVKGDCVLENEDFIAKFFLRTTKWEEVTLQNAKTVLHMSAQTSRISVGYQYAVDGHGNLMCEVTLGDDHTVVGQSSVAYTKKKDAMQDACWEAYQNLRKHCFTILQKCKVDKGREAISLEHGHGIQPTTSAGSEQDSMLNLGVAKKLMEKMGWKGGGIGKNQQGIKDPVSVQQVFGRECLGTNSDPQTQLTGVTPQFTRSIEKILVDYDNSSKMTDLIFASDFTFDQRKKIHMICTKLGLKSESKGKGRYRQLSVKKKWTSIQLSDDSFDD